MEEAPTATWDAAAEAAPCAADAAARVDAVSSGATAEAAAWVAFAAITAAAFAAPAALERVETKDQGVVDAIRPTEPRQSSVQISSLGESKWQ